MVFFVAVISIGESRDVLDE